MKQWCQLMLYLIIYKSSNSIGIKVELSSFYLAIINIQLEKNTNQCKDARALKEPDGCRVDAPQQLN